MKNNKMIFTAAICSLSLFLSGCSADEAVDIIISDNNGTGIVTERTLGFGEEITITEAEEPKFFSDIIASFPIDTILLPDGSSVDKSKADRVTVDKNGEIKLEFDFWFMRYAKPFFQSNIDGLGEYRESWDRFETGYDEAVDLKYEDYFKVKSGDTLENGMKVIKASFTVNEDGWYRDAYVELSGEVTYEGVLIRWLYGGGPFSQDDIVLLPNPTKDAPIPLMYHGDYDDVKYGRFKGNGGEYSFGETFVILDTCELFLGEKGTLEKEWEINLDDALIESPLSEVDFSYAKARATVKDIIFDDGNNFSYYNKGEVSNVESFEVTE